MKKRTLVAKLQERLYLDIQAADLETVGAGTVTITQGSDGHVIAVQDTAY